MKTSMLLGFAVVAMSLSAQTSFAQDKMCFRAKSGEATIKSLSTNKSENAWKIEATLEEPSYDENGEFIPPRFNLKAKSATMEYNTIAIHFADLGEGNFIVECDGGMVELSSAVNGLYANSKSLRGSVASSNTCGEADAVIVLKNLNLEETICAE
ncbi:hypothetical protein ACLVWU_11145 [Bdellovibrio sp. HCB290]|uniref:hypothetical protein n=1 Tax=Bdellovibrio sp. HCB290 TaxID=3394356 RepID=UPI0039B4985C